MNHRATPFGDLLPRKVTDLWDGHRRRSGIHRGKRVGHRMQRVQMLLLNQPLSMLLSQMSWNQTASSLSFGMNLESFFFATTAAVHTPSEQREGEFRNQEHNRSPHDEPTGWMLMFVRHLEEDVTFTVRDGSGRCCFDRLGLKFINP